MTSWRRTTRSVYSRSISLKGKRFKPEEIEVKIVDNYVVIHGKHEVRNQHNGNFFAREFTRRLMLPPNCEGDTVTSTLNLDGVLTILVPKKPIKKAAKQERQVTVNVDESK